VLNNQISRLHRAASLSFAVLAVAGWISPAAAQEKSLVRVDAVRTEPLSQTVQVIGRLVARQAGEVSARIEGPVETFYVDVGDRVREGEAIADLNNAILAARRDLAKGALAEAEAELATSRAEITLARQAHKRMEGLKSSAAFSQARFDDAKQTVVIAQAKARQAEAAVHSAEAVLRLSEINLSYTKVLAPYDGVVTRQMTEEGAYVRVGDPLVYLIAESSLEIEADVPFQRLFGLDEGTAVTFSLDDGTNHRARVRSILPSENPLTRTRAVRFTPSFNGIKSTLADAQSVTVQVPVGAPRDVLTVHKDAIIRRQGGNIVYVVKDDVAEARPIEIGESLGGRVEVLSGLEDGEPVVVRGNERLRPGAKIRIDGAS
jgi:RND family efflux transporter MFP subunit